MLELNLTYKNEGKNLYLTKFVAVLIFLYFFTLSADKIALPVNIFVIKINHLIAMFFLLFFMYLKKAFFVEKKLAYSFIFVFSSFLISSFFSPMIYRSIIYSLFLLFTIVVYFYLPLNAVLFFDERKIFKIYWLSFFFTGLYALSQSVLFQVGIKDPFLEQMATINFSRANAFSYEPSYYALYMTPYVMFENARVVFREKSSFKNYFFIFCINLFFIVSTSTGVVYSYLCYFFIMICFLFNKKKSIIYPFLKKRVLAFTSFFCVCFFSLNVLFPAVFIKTFYKFFSFLIGKSFWSFLSHGCFNIRLDGIKYGWKLFLKNPFFGVGIGGVGPTRCKEIYNVDLHDLPVGDLKHLDGTNVFMEMLASLGSYGFIAFTVLIVVYFSAFFNLLKNKNISAEQRLNVIAMIISLVVMGITQQFNQNLFRSYIWVYCAICYAYVYKIQFQIKET